MALVSMKEMLAKANEGHYAVGNFDVFNVEMVTGVIDAAEETRSPIILAFGGEFEKLVDIGDIGAYIRSAAGKASVPVALHLDHATEFSLVMRALKAGFTSVMVDASFKSLEDNIATTQEIVRICREYGVSVEAELGHVGGLGFYDEDQDTECYTVVKEAVRFVKETQIDALAVAVGTVHGVYKREPKLNINRLHELKEALQMPLVLHGGSGLSDEDLTRCVANGINKINIFTDLTLAAMDRMKADDDTDLNYLGKCTNVRDAVHKVAMDRMQVLRSAGKA